MSINFEKCTHRILQLRTSDRGYSNFTLIELLVTIAIIAILASMLLPALTAAREKAKSNNCIANQKQLAFAFNMYFTDWNDYLLNANASSLYVDLQPYVSAKNNAYVTMKVQRCQSQVDGVDTNGAGTTASPAYGYGRNEHLANIRHPTTLNWNLIKTTNITNPASCVFTLDGKAGTLYGVSPSGSANLVFRHNGGLNISFVDGHCRSLNTRTDYVYLSADNQGWGSTFSLFWWGRTSNPSMF